jgi:hypothetical protein
MELNKERGPIYSRYDRDRSDNYSAVIDYAAPPRTSEEIEFILAHKITPTEADPGDMRPGTSRRYEEGTTPLPAFLQLLSNSMTQRTPNQAASLQSRGQQQTPWAYQNRNARKNQALSKAALVGIIFWVLFMLVSMLFNVLGR